MPRLPRETRRLSDGRSDGVAVAGRRVDAIDANLKFRNVQKQTLSHGPEVGVVQRNLVLLLARNKRRRRQRLEGAAARVGGQHHCFRPCREDVVERLIPESFGIVIFIIIKFFVDRMWFK